MNRKDYVPTNFLSLQTIIPAKLIDMKSKGFYIGLMLLTMFACKKEIQQTGDIIHVDVLETSYPEKELLL